MSPERFALIIAAVIFGGGVIGLGLQRALPEKHTTGPARDMIGAVAGLLTLLCALVTGQGNRLNGSRGDVGCEGVIVPCGDFSAHAQ